MPKIFIAKKNIEYTELIAWMAQARQQAASTTASQMAFDASWKTGHLPLSLTGMMDSGFAGCFQLSSGSLLWNLPDLRPSGFPSVHRWQETRTRHKRKCHDNGRTRKRPFSRRLVWLPWLEYFPTERMEERTSLEAERSLSSVSDGLRLRWFH